MKGQESEGAPLWEGRVWHTDHTAHKEAHHVPPRGHLVGGDAQTGAWNAQQDLPRAILWEGIRARGIKGGIWRGLLVGQNQISKASEHMAGKPDPFWQELWTAAFALAAIGSQAGTYMHTSLYHG